MLFRSLSKIGHQYVTQLHEESKPFLEKMKANNKKFAERMRKAFEIANEELLKNKKADDK